MAQPVDGVAARRDPPLHRAVGRRALLTDDPEAFVAGGTGEQLDAPPTHRVLAASVHEPTGHGRPTIERHDPPRQRRAQRGALALGDGRHP
jgi:hypothetical protein